MVKLSAAGNPQRAQPPCFLTTQGNSYNCRGLVWSAGTFSALLHLLLFGAFRGRRGAGAVTWTTGRAAVGLGTTNDGGESEGVTTCWKTRSSTFVSSERGFVFLVGGGDAGIW